MPKFPNREPDVVALAEAMVAGYTAHAADFPSVTVATLTTALNNYKTQRTTKENAESQAQIATVTKDEKLDLLTELMKNDLKMSEVDTTADPEKLYEIGWGPRTQPMPITAPGSPTELHPTAEGQDCSGLSGQNQQSIRAGLLETTSLKDATSSRIRHSARGRLFRQPITRKST